MTAVWEAFLKIMNAFAPWSWIALAVVGMLAYDRWIDDPAVAAAARAGYVSEVKVAALQGQLDEAQRQARAAAVSASEHAAAAQRERDRADAAARQTQTDIALYEAERAADDAKAEAEAKSKGCPAPPKRGLTKRDLDFLGVH